MKINTIGLAHEWLKKYVAAGSTCIDATAGRGNDTLFLCELAGPTGYVMAFDIQQVALESTQQLLQTHNQQATLYLESHVHMAEHAHEGSVDAIVFNFGYLPGADHHLATQKETSIAAIEQGLGLLKVKGTMALCIYQGGDTGFEEKDAIMAYLKTLDYKKYTVVVNELYNRPNHPPLFVGIVKEK